MKHSLTLGTTKIRLIPFLYSLLLAVGACSSEQSLGAYKGSLSNLLPKEVGKFKLERTDDSPRIRLKFREAQDALQGFYKAYGDKRLSLIIFNFSSEDSAKAALQQLEDPGPAKVTVKKTAKKKGWSTVGNRIEMCRESSSGCELSELFWTNGSVLFIIDYDSLQILKPDDILEFEKIYPY